jgi:DNA transposition AAA+ family ATPase
METNSPQTATREDTAIDVDAQRLWIKDLHSQLRSWSEVGKRVGVPASTMSAFSAGTYDGVNANVARKVAQYRSTLAAHASVSVEMPTPPGFFECESATKLIQMLTFAQHYGEIVVAATAPGLCKSSSIRHYKACYSGTWIVTMSPADAGLNNMLVAVLKAMGEKEVKGTPQRLTERISEKVSGIRKPLLIFDDAQNMTEIALEQLRILNDLTGAGIAFFGNKGILQRFEGQGRQVDFAQMFSRLGLRHEQLLPLEQDVIALAQAWSIHEADIVEELRAICFKPGALRFGTKSLKLAHMMAAAEGVVLTAKHLRDAGTELGMRRSA